MAFPLTRILVLYFYIIDLFLTRIAFWPCVHVVSFPPLPPPKERAAPSHEEEWPWPRGRNIPAHLTAISLPCCPDAHV